MLGEAGHTPAIIISPVALHLGGKRWGEKGKGRDEVEPVFQGGGLRSELGLECKQNGVWGRSSPEPAHRVGNPLAGHRVEREESLGKR